VVSICGNREFRLGGVGDKSTGVGTISIGNTVENNAVVMVVPS
jgi:hypothetical protein